MVSLVAQKIGYYAKNFYCIVSFIFVVWMLFFDAEDWAVQWQLWRKSRQLKKQVAYYAQQIQEIKKKQTILSCNLEKYAREQYFMKKPGEDIYIVVP